MERLNLTADQAFQVLARVSMQTNRKVRDVADVFVRTGGTARRAVPTGPTGVGPGGGAG